MSLALRLPQEKPQTLQTAAPWVPVTASSAGFWLRFVATLIDVAILNLLSVPLNFFAIAALRLALDVAAWEIGFIFGINAFLFVSYFCLFDHYRGGTPGKLLLNLRVLHRKTGTYLPLRLALLRETVGKIVSLLPLGVGYGIISWMPQNLSLHDWLFCTRVVHLHFKRRTP